MTAPTAANACAIAVMAKAPQPGRSKTRLVPPLTAECAAALSAAFLRDVTENIELAARSAPIRGYVAYAPAGLERLFSGHLAAGTRLVLADGECEAPPRVKGFGRCLLHAIGALLADGFGAACVLNSDSPTLPTALLRHAAQALGAPGDRAVLGPASDGGYYLLGVKAPHAHLFEDIAWSSDRSPTRPAPAPALSASSWSNSRPGTTSMTATHSAGYLRNSRTHRRAPPYPAPRTAACIERFGVRRLLGLAA